MMLYLGFSYEKQRDFNLAESLYRVFAYNPENPKAAYDRYGLIKKGTTKCPDFLESVRQISGYAVAWWNLGLLYRAY